jgi:hypothetical protein
MINNAIRWSPKIKASRWLLLRTFGLLAMVLAAFILMGDGIGVWPFAMILMLGWVVTFRKKDEVERQADRFGLYAGGTIGMLAALVTGRFFDALGFWQRATPQPEIISDVEMQIFFIGMFHLTFCIVVGATLFRIGWWIAKR